MTKGENVHFTVKRMRLAVLLEAKISIQPGTGVAWCRLSGRVIPCVFQKVGEIEKKADDTNLVFCKEIKAWNFYLV